MSKSAFIQFSSCKQIGTADCCTDPVLKWWLTNQRDTNQINLLAEIDHTKTIELSTKYPVFLDPIISGDATKTFCQQIKFHLRISEQGMGHSE